MLGRLWQWVEYRWPARAVARTLTAEEIPGPATVKYSFGASALFVFILQAVTGVCQLFYYVPTTDHAYISLSYLRLEVPFGWLIHNLHYWGATVMVVLVLMHVTRVYIWGAYKKPRELTWLLGTLLLLLTMSMMFFGPPLPWDEKGYWATEVGTSMAGTVPLVGNWLKSALLGGDKMGQLTVSRFFGLHVAVLPGLLAGLILLHLVSFRNFGSVGPWREDRRLVKSDFWPDQVYKDLITAGIVFLVLVALSVFIPPPFSGPADPLDTSYQPKPEWTFLFLYQALKLFPGKLEVVGTVGLPLLTGLLLLCIPFIDRRSERNPARRPIAMAALVVAAAAVITLSLIGNASHPGAVSGSAGSGTPSQAATPSHGQPPGPAADPASGSAPTAGEGSKLFETLGCIGCHAVGGKGGKIGPDLSDEGSRNRSKSWLADQIRNPKSHFPKTVMPSFSSLKDSQVQSLVDYLSGLKGSGGPASGATLSSRESSPPPQSSPSPKAPESSLASQYVGSVSLGEKLFGENCQSCHGPQGTDKVSNPGSEDGTVPPLNPIDRELFDKDPDVFVGHIDHFLQDGSTPPGPNPSLKMPDFGRSKSLTQEQIANLEAYVLHLNGVDRARISHPGLRPVWFFGLTIAVFLAAALGFLAVGLIRKGRSARPSGSSRV
jgi:ubiquinol-cytochrome c reductase cytochrome b subunit